ncbi:metallophosphoesterase family protein [Methylobacterium nigriterrae]|uniref:metallophosphoesterase family protein n=1 Tax=Methylobacterium nigriterrae TaxID=3127512 RepID=UPI003013F27E
MAFLIDPRRGDIEDDASSPRKRSLTALAGTLLVEISLPKFALAWMLLIGLPCLLLGLAPLVAVAWLYTVSRKLGDAASGLWPWLVLIGLAMVGWLGGARAYRLAEGSFWSLNALVVQPSFTLLRETLRHASGHRLPARFGLEGARLHRATALGAGLLLSAVAALLVLGAWPYSRWTGQIADLASPLRLLMPALANSVVIVGLYLAVAALVWGIVDAAMDQPIDLEAFDDEPAHGRVWRVAHLSDLHVVGERYGFRIECGRDGPQGNGLLERVLTELERVHAERPLDLVLVTGDITDAGRSTEWAEFLDVLGRHPALMERMLILPGNHDVNVVDRANPARLDLPGSPAKRLRQLRMLAVTAGIQGERVSAGRAGDGADQRLSRRLASCERAIKDFSDGARSRGAPLNQLWEQAFPMVLAPETPDGLGVVLLNSNADTHFSFTNALGLIEAEQASRLTATLRAFPEARWIVALHHHLVEYPRPTRILSKRIGTALINGSMLLRRIQPWSARIVVMHGHRHVDWIGRCGGVRILSTPSPVMIDPADRTAHVYVHRLAARAGGLALLSPERLSIGVASAQAVASP